MFASLLPLFGLFLASGEAQAGDTATVRSMTVEQRLIVRVPIRARPMPAMAWEETKGPKCFPVSAIGWAFLSSPDSVDFILRNRQRVRARLDSECNGLDFYGGLYMTPEDNMVCARRDVIRSRVGGTCRIDKFRALVPRPLR